MPGSPASERGHLQPVPRCKRSAGPSGGPVGSGSQAAGLSATSQAPQRRTGPPNPLARPRACSIQSLRPGWAPWAAPSRPGSQPAPRGALPACPAPPPAAPSGYACWPLLGAAQRRPRKGRREKARRWQVASVVLPLVLAACAESGGWCYTRKQSGVPTRLPAERTHATDGRPTNRVPNPASPSLPHSTGPHSAPYPPSRPCSSTHAAQGRQRSARRAGDRGGISDGNASRRGGRLPAAAPRAQPR
jgi:hypothetical protein